MATESPSRWDDEYDAYQADQPSNRALTVDVNDSQWYQDARYDG